MRKTHIILNKHAYLVLSILELNKIVMYEFWSDKVKSIYGKKLGFATWRQLYSQHKNRRHLVRHFKRC